MLAVFCGDRMRHIVQEFVDLRRAASYILARIDLGSRISSIVSGNSGSAAIRSMRSASSPSFFMRVAAAMECVRSASCSD